MSGVPTIKAPPKYESLRPQTREIRDMDDEEFHSYQGWVAHVLVTAYTDGELNHRLLGEMLAEVKRRYDQGSRKREKSDQRKKKCPMCQTPIYPSSNMCRPCSDFIRSAQPSQMTEVKPNGVG